MIFISIVIPLYNKSLSIIKALNSINNQIYKNYEVIIVNDGSTDNSAFFVENWISSLCNEDILKYKLINQNNLGVSKARNTGVLNSKYDYIAFLDADDYWETTHLFNLNILVNNYQNHVDIFSSAIIQINNEKKMYPKLGKYSSFYGIVDFFKVSLISSGFINSSSVCVKKDIIKQFAFHEEMKNFEDTLIWAKISNSKGFAFNSDRTAIQVLDTAQASQNIDIHNFIIYEKEISNISYNGKRKYLFYFFIFNLSFFRLQLSFNNYIQKISKELFISPIFTICSLVVIFFPKKLIFLLRNIRKKR